MEQRLPQAGRGPWWARLLSLSVRVPDGAAGALVLLAMGGCWLLSYAGGGAAYVTQQWFYIPILLVAARFGYVWTALAAVGSGLLAGPLMPLDVQEGLAQDAWAWIQRAGFFLALGLGMRAVVERLRDSLLRELEVMKEQRSLALRKAAVIATVSHEFRTPLTVINGVVRTLEQQDLITDGGRPLLEGLVHAGGRLGDLVDAVISAVEGSEGLVSLQLQPVLLRDVLNDVVGRLGALDASTRVATAIEPGAEVVSSNATTLGHILRHLVDNALRFSASDAPVHVHAARVGAEVEIVIRDHGPGIDESFLEQATDPFTQHDQGATRSRGGLGIGLFAARRLTDVLGGRLTLRRHRETGTEAVVVLPGPPPVADMAEAASIRSAVDPTG